MRNLLRRDTEGARMRRLQETSTSQNTQVGTKLVLGSNTGLSGLPTINPKN